MEITLYKPQNPLLQNYIECIYRLERDSQDAKRIYLTFPTNFTIISVISNAQITVDQNQINVLPSDKNLLETYLTLNHQEPAWIHYVGAIDEITIYFKPLGINAFLENDLEFYYQNQYPKFDPFADYQVKMKDVLAIKNETERIELLENYWLSKFKGFEHPFLPQIVEELLNEEDANISDLSKKYGITRATLNNHFARHLCRTPSEFRKIARFRKAMKNHLHKSADENLTDISYQANYFDQSHFVKEFKTLTGFSPKKFFAQLTCIEDGQINWLFL